MPYKAARPVVLALPRGGLPVAAEVANALEAPLDILAVKKIGAPGHEELAVGAVSEEGPPFFNEDILEILKNHYGVSRASIEQKAAWKKQEVELQMAHFRKIRAPVSVQGRNVILVDDGLATGATMEAAVRVLRMRGAKRIVVAVPVAAGDSMKRLLPQVDDFAILLAPEEFFAVADYYQDFTQVEDAEAEALLREGNQAAP
jgi:putative phosphoribosyl transferase